MLIEKEILKFNPVVDLNALSIKLNWSQLQKQYLSYLQAKDSIEMLVLRLYQNGWLVNFHQLYQLIEALVQNKALKENQFENYFLKQNSVVFKPHSNTDVRKLTDAELRKIIAESIFFSQLPTQINQILFEKAVAKKIKINCLICKTNDLERKMFILLSGQVSIYKTNPKWQLLSVLNPGSIFGESGFFLGTARAADIAATQNSEILELTYKKENMDQLIKSNVAQALVQRFWIQSSIVSSDFFKTIPADCLEALIFSGSLISLKKDQVLFKQNELSQAAYLVVQGKMQIIQDNKVIANMTQGYFFGEISLTLTNGLRTAAAVATTDSLILEITRDKFYKLLSQNLFLAKEIQNLAFSRLEKDQQKFI